MVDKSVALGVLERVEDLLCRIAALAVLVMMILVSADAIGRYAFGAPVAFQFDLTSNYLMVIVGILALSWGERNGALIRITGLTRVLPLPWHGRLYALNNLLAAAVFAGVTYFSAKGTLRALEDGDVLFGVIDWPVWLSEVWVPLGAGVLTLRLLVNAAQYAFFDRPVVTADHVEDV